jgi:hypothetical protein
MGDQLPLPKGAIWLLVLLLIGVVGWEIIHEDNPLKKIAGFGVELEFDKTNNSPPIKASLVHQNLLASDYKEMYLNKRNLFGASIALDDSVKEALNEIPTGTIITNSGIKTTYGDPNNTTMVSTNESMSVGTRVDLSGAAFYIEPATKQTSEAQDIPTNNPHRNFAMWKWWVTPLEKGTQTLFIEAYTVDDKGHRKPINSTKKEIDVIVISTPGAEVTAPEDSYLGNETAEAAKEAAPGFESIFAITGLLAVAYLVLGRRE